MKEKILKLRKKGKTYSEIKKILGCAKSTISFHCGKGQKIKSLLRQRSNRKNKNVIIRIKLDKYARSKVLNFKRGRGWDKVKSNFNYDSAYNKIINNPYCYLTGRKIDLIDTISYHLDHIVPISKKGKNTLKNMGLTCKDANLAKSGLTVYEFISLCKEVLEHNGYTVNKNKVR